jgi:hypothetical protein
MKKVKGLVFCLFVCFTLLSTGAWGTLILASQCQHILFCLMSGKGNLFLWRSRIASEESSASAPRNGHNFWRSVQCLHVRLNLESLKQRWRVNQKVLCTYVRSGARRPVAVLADLPSHGFTSPCWLLPELGPSLWFCKSPNQFLFYLKLSICVVCRPEKSSESEIPLALSWCESFINHTSSVPCMTQLQGYMSV